MYNMFMLLANNCFSQETYALKRKLRQNDSNLKDLWKEREDCAKQLRTIDPHRLSTPQSKFTKADVIKELKWVCAAII